MKIMNLSDNNHLKWSTRDMQGTRIILLFFNLLIFPSPLFANDDTEQNTQSTVFITEGVSHYGNREYRQAIESFKKALEISEEPELMYNIARSYERLIQSEEALVWYQRLLETPGTTGELRSKALTNIAAIREEMAAKQRAAKTETPDKATEKPNETPQTSDASQPLAQSVNTDKRKQKQPKPSPLKIAGAVLTGVGSATVITGAVFGALVIKTHNEYESAGFGANRLALRDDVKQYAIIADAAIATGAALTTAGITMLILGALQNPERNRNSSNEISRIRPIMNFQSDRIRISLTGRF